MEANEPKIGRRAEDVNVWMKPARRVYVAVLFILMCTAFAAGYFFLQNKFEDAVRSGCERSNAVRNESNNRIESHVQDSTDLVRLLEITTKTRNKELSAWSDLNKIILAATPKAQKQNAFFNQYESDIVRLINTYRDARDRDAEIQQDARNIHFDKLAIVDCSKVTSS